MISAVFLNFLPACFFSTMSRYAWAFADNILQFRTSIKRLVSISDPLSNSFNLKMNFLSFHALLFFIILLRNALNICPYF